MKIKISLLLILYLNLYPAFIQNEQGQFVGNEQIRGDLIIEWVTGDYSDIENGQYYRELNFYILPYYDYYLKIPGLMPYSYKDNGDYTIKVFKIDGEFMQKYKDNRIFLYYEYELEEFAKQVFTKLPDNFFEYEGGYASIPIELTLTNYFIEVYPGGGEYFEQNATIENYKYLENSEKSLKMHDYREADYPLLNYKSKDDYINIRETKNGKIIYKIYKNTFNLGDVKLLEMSEDDSKYDFNWYKILYLDRDKNDYFLGYVHKSQMSYIKKH